MASKRDSRVEPYWVKDVIAANSPNLSNHRKSFCKSLAIFFLFTTPRGSWYVPILNNQVSEHMIKGSCLCGKVKFQISGEPFSLSYCHCSRCRKAAGVFSAVLVGKADDFWVT